MSSISLRRATPEDLDPTSRICFEAFNDISRRHSFPPDFPALEVARGLMELVLSAPFVWGVVAEHNGQVVGSNFLWEWEPIAGVGPVTVDPSAQNLSVGRMMMESLMQRAREKRFAGVRLVQAAFNSRSMSLYTKIGYEIREPLVCLTGPRIGTRIHAHAVRLAVEADLDACNDLCRRVHGHDRADEVASAIKRGTATVVEHGGRIVGYASDIGFFGHIVAETNDGLCALIAAAEQISGPGLLLPSRNAEVFRWCLASGLKVVQPMTLMSYGLYNKPRGAFVPSILY